MVIRKPRKQRPTIPRPHQFNYRMTDAENEQFLRLAKRFGKNKSNALRYVVSLALEAAGELTTEQVPEIPETGDEPQHEHELQAAE